MSYWKSLMVYLMDGRVIETLIGVKGRIIPVKVYKLILDHPLHQIRDFQ